MTIPNNPTVHDLLRCAECRAYLVNQTTATGNPLKVGMIHHNMLGSFCPGELEKEIDLNPRWRVTLRKINHRLRRAWWSIPLPPIRNRRTEMFTEKARLACEDHLTKSQRARLALLNRKLGLTYRYTPEQFEEQKALAEEVLAEILEEDRDNA